MTGPQSVASALRDYQRSAVDLTNRAITEGDQRLYLSLPTGTGKTRILAELARQCTGRVLAVAHTRELVGQLADGLATGTGRPVGTVMAGDDTPAAGVVAGSVQTLRRRRLRAVIDAGPIDRLFIDECHHATVGNAYGRLIGDVEAACPGVVTVGVTATPWRSDRHRMSDVLPRCVFERSIAAMAEAGWLAPLRWRRVAVSELDLSSVRTRTADGEPDYDLADLAAAVGQPSVAEATAALTAPLLDGRLTVVFAVDVQHALKLTDAYRAEGLTAGTIWGAMPATARAGLLADWRAGRVQVVTSVATLLEGFDLPELRAAIIARPTQSPGRYVQQIGRVSRIAPGKADALIIDVTESPFGAESLNTRQLTLPVVTGEFVSDSESVESGVDVGKHRRVARLLNPLGEAVTAFGRDSSSGIYYAAAGEDVAALLIPARDKSGLFVPVMMPLRGRPAAHRLSDHPMPLRDGVGAIAVVLAQNGRLPSLVNRRAPWRSAEPTVAQLDYLGALDTEAGQVAQREAWSKGEVALAITGALALQQLRRFAANVRQSAS